MWRSLLDVWQGPAQCLDHGERGAGFTVNDIALAQLVWYSQVLGYALEGMELEDDSKTLPQVLISKFQ